MQMADKTEQEERIENALRQQVVDPPIGPNERANMLNRLKRLEQE